MKTIKINILLIVSLLGIANLGHAKGNERGNAGNEVALQFVHTLIQTFPVIERQLFSTYKLDGFTNTDLNRLKDEYKKVKIEVVNYKLCKDDMDQKCPEEDGAVAKNYPRIKLIRLNSDRWKLLDPREKSRIALHEFLGILGYEINTYGISSQIVAYADQSLENSDGYVCQISVIYNSKQIFTQQREFVLLSFTKTTSNFSVGGFGKSREFKNRDAFEFMPEFIEESGMRFNVVQVRGVIGEEYLRLTVELKNVVDGKDTQVFTLIPETVIFSGHQQAFKIIKLDNYNIVTSCSRYFRNDPEITFGKSK